MSRPASKACRPSLVVQQAWSFEREERTDGELTNGLVGDLVASNGDRVPVYEPLNATLEIRHLEVDI